MASSDVHLLRPHSYDWYCGGAPQPGGEIMVSTVGRAYRRDVTCLRCLRADVLERTPRLLRSLVAFITGKVIDSGPTQ